MSTNPSLPPAPKKGLSGIAVAGFGCLGLLLLAGVAGMMLINKGCQKVRQMTEESGGKPAKMLAQLAVATNPNLEIVSTDDAKGEMTLREKKSGKTITMPMNDLARGKFTIQESDGKTTTVDVSQAAGGKLTVEGPEGRTVISTGSDASTLPAWIPAYPGAQNQPGGMRGDTPEGVAGNASFTTTDPVAKVRQFYEAKLKADGFETQLNTFASGGKEIVSIDGDKNEGKTSLNLIISGEEGRTTVQASYQGPK